MFGDNLKKYRRQKGYSQSELASKLFVSRQCISKWEKGVTQPDLETLNKISELLGVSIDVLIKDDCDDVTTDVRDTDLNRILLIVNILVALFCVFAFVSLWRFLPQRIPAHWTHGAIDRYGSSAEIFLNLITVAVFLIVGVITYFVLRSALNHKLIIGTHLVIVGFQVTYLIFIVVMYANYITAVLPLLTCLSASLILCVSIAMHPKIAKQNQWLGVRTRETLSDKTVWNKTNALACYLFTACSLIIWIVSFIVVSVWSCTGFLAYILLTAVVVVYSKLLAKSFKEKV